MTAPLEDQIIAPVVADLLACLAVEVAKEPDPPSVVCVRVGDRTDLLISETYDECCAGLAWVRFARQYPSGQANFPAADELASPCSVTRWALVFELGIARCAPTADAGSVPSCAEWTDLAVNHYADVAALRRTICCYEQSQYAAVPGRKVFLGEFVPQTTEGGCTSVVCQVIISALACDPVCRS